MSTAGKVLVVLCMLFAAVWVVLFSGVAELNKSGTQAVERLQKQVESLEADVAKDEREIVALKDAITLEQVTMAEQLAVLRSRQSDADRDRTEKTEMATRVKLQLDGAEATLNNSKAASELRLAEREAEKKAKAEAEAEVEKLEEEHTELVTELDKLRADFKETLEANRRLADRAAKAGAKPGS